ncbi:MAG: signal peptidase I [Bacilli bacterium]|nr:signal peptidase I [Bacilli bacterium]
MSEKKKLNAKLIDRILTIVGIVLCVILLPILLMNVTMIIKSWTNDTEVPSVGKVIPFIVLTDSMDPEIKSGDLIICNKIDPDEVKVDDIISFFDPAGNGVSVVTHRVLEIIEEDGTLKFRTKGDNNNTEDQMLVPADKVIGIYKFRIGGLGNVAMFMSTTAGLILCVFCPLVLFIGYDIVRRKINDNKNKQDTDALLAELEALKAEKAATQASNDQEQE